MNAELMDSIVADGADTLIGMSAKHSYYGGNFLNYAVSDREIRHGHPRSELIEYSENNVLRGMGDAYLDTSESGYMQVAIADTDTYYDGNTKFTVEVVCKVEPGVSGLWCNIASAKNAFNLRLDSVTGAIESAFRNSSGTYMRVFSDVDGGDLTSYYNKCLCIISTFDSVNGLIDIYYKHLGSSNPVKYAFIDSGVSGSMEGLSGNDATFGAFSSVPDPDERFKGYITYGATYSGIVLPELSVLERFELLDSLAVRTTEGDTATVTGTFVNRNNNAITNATNIKCIVVNKPINNSRMRVLAQFDNVTTDAYGNYSISFEPDVLETGDYVTVIFNDDNSFDGTTYSGAQVTKQVVVT